MTGPETSTAFSAVTCQGKCTFVRVNASSRFPPRAFTFSNYTFSFFSVLPRHSRFGI